MRIAITSLIKNREWILPDFLNKIMAIDYDKSKISLIFIDDYSNDNSLAILNRFNNQCKDLFENIIIVEPNDYFSNNESSRILKDRNKLYEHLSGLRNKLIEKCIEIKVDYQLSIDSDILVSQDILNHLLNFKKDYIATIVLNDNHLKDKFDYDNLKNRYINASQNINNNPIHFKNYELNNLYEVNMSGACYLISNKLFKFRFKNHRFGEDSGYCEDIIKEYKIYLETTLKSIHIMERKYLNAGLSKFEELFKQ